MSRHLSRGNSNFSYVYLVLVVLVFLTASTLVLAGHKDSSAFAVDDQGFNNTTTDNAFAPNGNSYLTEVAFFNHNLSLNVSGSHIFNVTEISGGSLAGKASGNTTLSTNATSEGRYRVYNTSSNKSDVIDLFAPNWNATGRIRDAGTNNFVGISGSDINISARYWLNGSRIPVGDKIKTPQSLAGTGVSNEFFYKFNDSKRRKYWLQVDIPGYGSRAHMSRNISLLQNSVGSGYPFINDFEVKTNSSVNVLVLNASDANNAPITDSALKARLERYNPGFGRDPYFTSPPFHTNVTDNGWANFTKVNGRLSPQVEKYKIEILNNTVNRKLAKNQSDVFRPDVEISSDTTKDVNITLTPDVGNITGKIKGTDKEGIRYAVAAMNLDKGRRMIFPLKNSGKFTTDYMPNGTYEVFAGKVTPGSSSPSIVTAGSFKVNKSNSTDVGTIEFPVRVELNGSVVDASNGKTISNARVFLRNQTKNSFAYPSSDINGSYSTKLKNDTVYDVTVVPPRDSKYVVNQTSVEVYNNTVQNLTLSTGPTITGQITNSSGDGVSGVEVRLWNRSLSTFGQGTTNETGYYNISGLRRGNYSVDIYPPTKYSAVHSKANASWDDADFTILGNGANLTGNITDENGNTLDATVTVKSSSAGISRETQTESSGLYRFNDLPKGVLYRITIEANSSFRERKRSLRIRDNTTQDFNLSYLHTVKGNISNINGGGIGGAIITATNSTEGSSTSTRTASNGSYSFDLPAIKYGIQIKPGEDSDFNANRTSINGSHIKNWNSVNFTLSSSVVMAGNITAFNLSSNFSGEIGLRNATKNAFEFQEFQGGSYNFTSIRNISYEVWISVDNSSYPVNTTYLSYVPPDNTKNFNVSRPDGRKLKVTVGKNGSSETIANATVFAGNEQKKTNSNGEAIFRRFQTNTTVLIRANKEGYEGAFRTIRMKNKTEGSGTFSETEEFQNETLNLVERQDLLEANVNITKNGKRKSGITVIFSSNKTNVSQTSSGVTGENGEATLTDLVPGGYNMLFIAGPSSGASNRTAFNGNNLLEEKAVVPNATAGDFRVGVEVDEQ